MSWKKTITSIDSNDSTKSWRNTIQDEIGSVEAGKQGVFSGLTLDFDDELGGALEATGRAVGIKGLGAPSISETEFTTPEGLNFDALEKAYIEARDRRRNIKKEALEQNPAAYTTGQIGGSIASSMIPGLNAAKATTLSGRMGLSAAQGGLVGLGTSEADNLSDASIDTLSGAGLNAAFQGLGEKVISPLASKASNAISKGVNSITDGDSVSKYLLKKFGNSIANISDDVTERYLNNPDAVNKSMTIGELAEDLLQNSDKSDSLMNQMYDKVSKLSGEAIETLNPSRSIQKGALIQGLDDLAESLNVDGVLIGDSRKKAAKILQGLSNDIGEFGENIPEPTIKRIIQAIDDDVDWDKLDKSVADKIKRDLRVFVDSQLKDQNPAYKQAMLQTERASEGIATVKKAFQNRQNPESFDKFINSVKGLERKSEFSDVNKALNAIKESTGVDLREQILNAQAKSDFIKDTTNGSRKTMLGKALGGAAEFFPGKTGEAFGAAIGAASDKFAGRTFKAMLDGKIGSDQFFSKYGPKLGKYSKPLMDAASRGSSAMAATHFILQQNDPTYRKLMQQLDSEDKE